jgi:RNA polymerase sigma-70 factor (ECF subfamily)
VKNDCKIVTETGNKEMSEPDSTLHTRPSLLVRLRDARDEESWRTFVDTYGPLLYRWCRRRGLQDADAADVSQETLAEVARCIRTFAYQPERGRFRDRLATVTRRRLIRFHEQRGRGVAAAGGEADQALAQCSAEPADAEWTAAFHAHVLRVALDRVRPHFAQDTWRAFELTWLDGRPSIEVADRLGVPIDAVYLARCRVLKRLEEEVLLLAEDLPHLVSGH